jgi:hypothetical protein
MEEEVKKLREAGFSDEDIRAYMEEKKSSSSSTAPAPVSPDQVASEPNKVDETVPDYGGTPETSWKETLGTIGTAVAPYALPVALGTAGLATGAGLYKFGSKALDVGRSISDQMAQRNAIEATRETRLANRPGFGGTPRTAPASAPTYNVPTNNAPRPVSMPASAQPPTTASPAAAQQSGIIQRGMDYANQMRKVAADKVMQGVRAAAPIAENVAGAARAVAPAAIGLTAALMPGNAGQRYNFPQKGPYAGMEINPKTGRPWTEQELAQYR